MLYNLLLPFKDSFSIINLFEYITFRAGIAAITALFISFIIGPWVIHILHKNQIGEEIRSTGPKSHMKKEGTPTMGGVIILMAVLLPTLLFSKINSVLVQIIIFATIWMGVIGFLDDYLKVIKKMKRGLIARYKLAGQISLGCIVSFWILNTPEFIDFNSKTTMPFFKNVEIDLGMLYPLMVILVITGTSNAVNLTDGLDGLATVPVILVAACFAFISYVTGNIVFSEYLQIPYIAGVGEVAVFLGAVIGSCIGFLWFNAPPAKIFMGDTGSLALGGSLGAVGIITKHEIVLAITGGLFVLEAVSVIVQVISFKLTGKRIFKMAPIHHHYEKKGWPESTVVIRFWIVAIILAMIGLATLKFR